MNASKGNQVKIDRRIDNKKTCDLKGPKEILRIGKKAIRIKSNVVKTNKIIH
jgi:hypothetical protein